MHQFVSDRRRKPTAFSIYLRTGRCVVTSEVEVKFNPWHDPADGRFTFAHQGTYHPGGGQDGAGQSHSTRSGGGNGAQKPSRSLRAGGGSFGGAGSTGSAGKPNTTTRSGFRGAGGASGGGGATGSWGNRNRSSGFRGGGGSFGGAGASGSWGPAKDDTGGAGFQSRGGSFGGAGATGAWEQEEPKRKKIAPAPVRSRVLPPAPGGGRSGIRSRPPSVAAKAPSADPKSIEKNGYTYEFDASDRTRRVTGTLVLEPAGRSRPNQANAGKPDRLPKDEGGHYIAQRFNGPTDAFNHFAQNGNFNRSGYAKLEYKWAMSIQKGHKVSVDIKSLYEGDSRRPHIIEVIYEIDGKESEIEFDNDDGAEK